MFIVDFKLIRALCCKKEDLGKNYFSLLATKFSLYLIKTLEVSQLFNIGWSSNSRLLIGQFLKENSEVYGIINESRNTEQRINKPKGYTYTGVIIYGNDAAERIADFSQIN